MSKQDMQYTIQPGAGLKTLVIALGTALWLAAPVQAAEPAQKKPASKPATVKKLAPPAQPAQVQPSNPIEFASQVSASVGKSTLLRLPTPAARVSVGNPDIADVILLNPSEIYLLGKKVGTTNVILWNKAGQSTLIDIVVGTDTAGLQGKLLQLLPGEKNIKVYTAADTVVLSGSVSDAIKVSRAVALAEAFGGKKVVNMLSVSSVQQVMLEVKIAEINRTELDKLGLDLNWQNGRNFLTGIIGGGTATLTRLGQGAYFSEAGGAAFAYPTTSSSISVTPTGTTTSTSTTRTPSPNYGKLIIDAQRNDGLVKILAEPNIVAISGQEGSFLAGGEILIPVADDNGIELKSKEFGVGLKFTPTVLEDGLIQMRVSPEVTDLVGFNSVATSALGNVTLVPTLTTRRVSTSVELHEGQSLAIGGLLQDTSRKSIDRFPILGELPILGALFRSSEYQKNKTELVIVVTPRLVKPLPPNYVLPTDNLKEPSRSEFLLEGKLESKSASQPAAVKPDQPQAQTPASSGFEMK